MTVEEEVVQWRAELAEARALIAELRTEIERLRSEDENVDPPAFVKPNTPKSKDQHDKQQRRNSSVASEPKSTILLGPAILPLKRYSMRCKRVPFVPILCATLYPSGRRQVIELSQPQPMNIVEHQLFKSWCAHCCKWHYASVDLSAQVVGQSRMVVRIVLS